MVRKKVTQPDVSAIDFTATVRPIKIAFIVDDDTSIKWILDEVIPWISTVWGGGNFFFFPTNKSGDDQHFEVWIKLLQKYDPDKVISTGAFSDTLLNLISANILTYSQIFQYDPKSVSTPKMCHRDRHAIPFEDLFSSSKKAIPLIDIKPTGSDIHDLWFFSHFGRLGKYFEQIQNAPNCVCATIYTLSISEIEKNCEAIAKGEYPNNFSNGPLPSSMEYLGYSGAIEHIDGFSDPDIIVIGEQISDWCLFQTLKNFYFDVYWIPPSFLSKKGETTLNHFDLYLYRLLSENDKEKCPQVISTSLCENKRREIIEASFEARRGTFPDAALPLYEVKNDFDSLIKNWVEWGEINNYKDTTLVFQGPLSLQKAPFLSPKNFRLKPGKAKYRIDLHTNNYKFLGHHMSDKIPLDWPNKRAISKDDGKRTYVGGISFNPVQHLTFTGQELDSALHGPRIVKQSLFSDLETIFMKKLFRPIKSIGTMNINSVLELWNNSVDLFNRDYFKNDSSKIFKAFRLGKNVKNNKLGLNSSEGIFIGRKFLFSLPIQTAFSPSLNDLSDESLDKLIESEILIRGQKLKCLTCGLVEFYPESDISRTFSCKRCGEIHTKNLKTMGSIDPRPLYDMSPLLYGLQETNSDLVLFGAKKIKDLKRNYFEFECEIEIHHEGGCIQEIDLIGNLDGRLVAGECKSNGELNGKQLDGYVKLCKNFNVQHFFCVSSSGWSPQMQKNILSKFQTLKYIDVKFISLQ